MTTESNGRRAAGWLLIFATLSALLVMAHHPTIGSAGYDSLIDEVRSEAFLNRMVHGAMIVFTLCFYIGLKAHSDAVGRGHFLSRCADAALAFATFTMIGAALFSGFVTTELAFRLDPQADGSDALFRQMLKVSYSGNQVLAKAGVLGYGAAIALTSVRLLTSTPRAWVVGSVGIVLGALLCAGIVGGSISLHVQGMAMVLALMALWFLGVGARMVRGA